MEFTRQLLDLPPTNAQAAPTPRFGPFRIVQPSHVEASPLRELTQDQALIRAKQDARCAATCNLLIRRKVVADDRRFTGEPLTNFGSLS